MNYEKQSYLKSMTATFNDSPCALLIVITKQTFIGNCILLVGRYEAYARYKN